MPILFFRNDDVRNVLDDALIEITNLFIRYNIPLIHSVEPANVSKEVVEWLIDTKGKHPLLIEIMQHGYDHKIKNKMKKGEFGGQREYEEQYLDIKHGKELMDNYFGNQWFPAFNFPYAPYNKKAIEALNNVGYLVFNSHYNSGLSRRIFYTLGHVLNKGLLFDHHVSWNLQRYPKTKLFEIDMNISFIKRYIDEQVDSDMYGIDELIRLTERYRTCRTIGVLLHHRYHNSGEKISLVKKYLDWCKKQNYSFSTLKDLYKRFARN